MVARKKVCPLQDDEHRELRGTIDRVTTAENDRNAMFKDMCLIEAAIATDQLIVSLDDTARSLFGECARQVGELRNIAWVNPANPDETPIPWLKRGANLERCRRLGS
jgi:hypothetical protein